MKRKQRIPVTDNDTELLKAVFKYRGEKLVAYTRKWSSQTPDADELYFLDGCVFLLQGDTNKIELCCVTDEKETTAADIARNALEAQAAFGAAQDYKFSGEKLQVVDGEDVYSEQICREALNSSKVIIVDAEAFKNWQVTETLRML